MTVFDDTDIQQLADFAADFALKDDCDILRDVPGVLDPMGGSPHTWPVFATVKSAVVDWRPPSQEYVVAHQIMGKVLKKVFLPLGTVVLQSDHLSIKGITYKVIDPIPPSSYSVFSEVVAVTTTLGV